MTDLVAQTRSATVKAEALKLGFDLAGITPAQPTRWPDAYRAWIAAGKHGAMSYLATNLDARFDIRTKFPWARSIICVAMYYYHPEPEAPQTDPAGRIARYAWGRDYHKVVGNKLRKLEAILADKLGPHESRSYSDTGPLLEREVAVLAGLGWMGKNTLLINRHYGSYCLLGEIVTSHELPPDTADTDHCGTCTRCIDACPTEAITPYSVDARRCISYQTLENRGEIPAELHAAIAKAGFIAGCDICQEVCPHNRQPPVAAEPDFAPQATRVSLPVIQSWSEQDWDIFTRGKAHRRAKYPMWQRNADILRG